MARIFVEGWDPEYGTPLDQDEALAPAEGSVDPTVETRRLGAARGRRRRRRARGVRRRGPSGRRPAHAGRSGRRDPRRGWSGRSRWAPRGGTARLVAPRSRPCASNAGRCWPAAREEQMPPVDARPGRQHHHLRLRRSRPPHDGAAHQDAPRRGRDRHRARRRVLRGRRRPAQRPHRATRRSATSRAIASPTCEPDRNAVVAQLAPGQRTPLFCIARLQAATPGTCGSRCSTAGTRGPGIVRCEASGQLPKDDAATIADRTAALLPIVASEPHVDPRAPQNLVPIGALEKELRHRMGDRGLVYRALREAVDASGRRS